MTTYIYSAIDRETGMTVKNSISSTMSEALKMISALVEVQ